MKYWTYIKGEVPGSYEPAALAALPGFTMTTLVCPGEGEIVAHSKSRGELVRYSCITPGTDVEGDIEAISMWAGQGVGLVKKLQPAAAILHEIYDDASSIMKRLGGLSA